jgi:hypothetical protein
MSLKVKKFAKTVSKVFIVLKGLFTIGAMNVLKATSAHLKQHMVKNILVLLDHLIHIVVQEMNLHAFHAQVECIASILVFQALQVIALAGIFVRVAVQFPNL